MVSGDGPPSTKLRPPRGSTSDASTQTEGLAERQRGVLPHDLQACGGSPPTTSAIPATEVPAAPGPDATQAPLPQADARQPQDTSEVAPDDCGAASMRRMSADHLAAILDKVRQADEAVRTSRERLRHWEAYASAFRRQAQHWITLSSSLPQPRGDACPHAPGQPGQTTCLTTAGSQDFAGLASLDCSAPLARGTTTASGPPSDENSLLARTQSVAQSVLSANDDWTERGSG